MTPPPFAVDRMLGRLATWLRLLGFDASYGAHLSGRTLIRHARAEGRVVLTRDHKLSRTLNLPPLLFIDSDHFRDQLRQVIEAFDLAAAAQPLSRCARCNQLLESVAKDEIASSVPPYTLETQSRFARCPRCRRVYWPATHLERIQRELAAVGIPVAAKVD